MKVVKVNPKGKTVEVVNLQSNEKYDYDYDKLVIASGASPIKPPVEGLDLKGVFFMRTPEDAVRLRESIEKNEIKRAVVVGAGFIGLEVAENMAKQGVKASVIDMAEHVLPGFDEEMSEYIENHLAENGIMTATGVKMEGIIGTDRVEKIKTSRRTMKADAVVLAIGIRANTSFLQDSGIELMPNKTIKVNKYLQTNIEDVYSIGDCVCVVNKITKLPQWSQMGSSANIEGRLTAKNILGKNESYGGVLGTAVCKLPNLNTGRTGLSEVAAKEAGYNPISVISVVDDKAHYYPGADSFVVKMIADKDTKKLLGLQLLGSGDVDKMVDIAVTAISLNASKVVDGILEINEEVCNHCGRCIGQCPFDAIEYGTYGYKIYIGGRWGKKINHGIALNKVFTNKKEALDVIEKAILLYREQGKTGERFASTIERLGFENIEKQLLSNDLLERKEEIIIGLSN